MTMKITRAIVATAGVLEFAGKSDIAEVCWSR